MAAVLGNAAFKGMDFMKLDYRQRLLATTLLVGASLVATPAFAQDPQSAVQPTEPDAEGTPNPPDTSAVPTIPQTTAPVEGTPIPSNNAMGEPTRGAQDIIVTGSRIPQPNLESSSPVTVVTSQEVKVSGTTRTEDLVNSLPQVFAGQGSNISNGATGTATVDLRGLGSKRNLILVNGRRLQPGDPGLPSADINFIPTQLIKRVDVLTGGASSVYGADAVTGVVNFIMDTTFTGFRIDGQASVFNHHQHANDDVLFANTNTILGKAPYHPPTGWSTNGGAQDIAGVFGAAFDDGRGHVQAYATYRTQDPLMQSTRDYSFCALGSLAPQYVPDYGNFYCGGSSTSAEGSFRLFNPLTGKQVSAFHVEGDQFVPGTTLFNYAPYNYYQRPDERYTFGAFADYEISPGAKPYLEVMFMNDHSDAQIAPSGNFSNTSFLNCDNPLLSDQQRDAICGDPALVINQNGVEGVVMTISRRNVEGGGRDDDLEHTAFRAVGGMRGDLWNGISYDAYYQFGKTLLSETYFNDFSIQRIGRSLDVVTDPDTGLPVCRSVLDGTDDNCVPWNIFETGGVTDEALNYLQVPGYVRGNVAETVAHADFTINGDEYGWRLPWAENGVGINVGAEYRKESLRFDPDIEFQTGDLAGQGATTPPVRGSFDVRDLFGEIQIPVVQNSFIDELTLNAGYRYSNYNVAGRTFNTDTYKIAGELAPIEDVRFRASYNRAVRAPNIVELFQPQRLQLLGSEDYCAGDLDAGGTTVNGFTLEECARSGVTPALFGNIAPNPASQYNAITGGNVDLNPEKADTITAGVVIQPRFIPGLALTADYFNIKVDDVIGTIPWQTVLLTCIQQGGPLCDLVHRDQFGTLWLTPEGTITVTNQNVGKLKTEGFDFQGNYSRRLGGVGTANVSFVGTYLKKLYTNPFGEVAYDCVGFYGSTCGTPNPKWRHKLRVGLTMPSGLGFSVQWRHFAGVDRDTLSDDIDLNGNGDPSANPGDARLSARDYFDLAFTARMAQRLNLRMGVNNVFDRDPPLEGTSLGSGNTFPQVYDALGRYLFAGFTIDF
jgi:outer membrane receptor protein involved in Fe transport